MNEDSRQLFPNRRAAGRQLGGVLKEHVAPDAVLLGLPRGGVIVAAGAAEELPLASIDVYVVRKLRAPSNPEFAIGALAEDGGPLFDEPAITQLHVPLGYLEEEEDRERQEIQRQVSRYRQGRPMRSVGSSDAVLIDDGIATGATVGAAIRGLRTRGPGRLIVATPVTSPAARSLLAPEADEVIALWAPPDFWAVGQFYEEFEQVTDEEVVRALDVHRRRAQAP